MKGKWLLGLLLLGWSCSPLPTNQQSKSIQSPGPPLPSPTWETVSVVANEPEDESENKKVPPEFKGIDFKNFSYQTNWRNRRVRLTNGEYVHNCQTKGSSIQESYDSDEGEDEDQSGGKFISGTFTRFGFEFKKGRFIKSSRQVLPNPNPDVRNYKPQVSIRD